jgi:hypothetical protein
MLSNHFLLLFSPDGWSPPRRFGQFLGPPFPTTGLLPKATSAAENRRQKLHILIALASDLRSGLTVDNAEVESQGFSPATGSKKYAAMAETIILELYSILDALRTTIFAAYRNVEGVQNQSTERFFRRAHERGYGPGFPASIRESLSSAYDSWFQELRDIRVEVSHGDVGSCHLDATDNKIRYTHHSIGHDRQRIAIDDLETMLNRNWKYVLAIVDEVFEHLCSRLEPVELRVPCGLFKGRLYERTVSYDENLHFGSGTCFSKHWFEAEPDHLCPLRQQCGAYQS